MAGRPSFDPARHPRDRFGRFTKSRTVKASAKDKSAARNALDGFSPQQVDDQHGYLAGIAAQPAPVGDLAGLNKALRAGDEHAAGVDVADRAMIALPDDVLLSRTVPVSAFGHVKPEDLAGMKVRDAGFSATQLGTVTAQPDSVRMHIAAPAGTRAAVDPATGEVLLDRDTEMVVSKVESNSAGGHDMYLTVLPKAGGKGDGKQATPSGKGSPAEADKPGGEAQVRADLLKLKIADLQAQMRDRGLKPGKKRKSELVDALVADRIGSGSPSAHRPESKTMSFADRVAAAAVDQDTLDAAPLSLVKQETHTRLGNRAGLSVESRDALATYQGAEYAVINGTLRDAAIGDPVPPDAEVDGWIAAIDKAMTSSALTSDVVTWRGARRATKIFGDRFSQDLTGMEWSEPSYTSTTASRGIAEWFASPKDGVRMRIVIPAGVGAVQVSAVHNDDGVRDEAELLLQRGLKMRVAADHGFAPDGVRDIDVEVLP